MPTNGGICVVWTDVGSGTSTSSLRAEMVRGRSLGHPSGKESSYTRQATVVLVSPLLSITLQAAERVLHPHCGINVDIWMVGRKPIGLYKPAAPTEGPEVGLSCFLLGLKSLTASQTLVFFYKTHILAGQVEPNGSSVVDFAWLTREEIKGCVERGYWHGVKNMLSDL